ncbi:hypothetical protein PHMEG_00026365 [Phytophthora megakarya]|uniref:Uncharacterized protein n=1 Tax=Phytophthora megakarya TaxID=4795 RepID=A0A225V8N4_9STRA|nr:hypothetical protein PHMEG_00026365 [Phytophthora megakarya]
MQLLSRQYDAKGYIEATCIQNGVTPDAGYKEMLERAENTLLDIKKVLRSDAFNDTSKHFVDTSIEREGRREVFVVKANVILPFGMMTAANALWTVLSTDKIGEFCYFHRVAQKTENTIAQAFGIRCADEDVDADFRGKYTFSRFKDEDRMVIVWVAEFEPVELNGVRCCGIKCQTTGWIQLSEQLSGHIPKQQSGKVSMTQAYAYSRLNLESDPSKCSDMLPLHSFFCLAQRMHDKFMLSYSSVLEKALFEEDWKMNME